MAESTVASRYERKLSPTERLWVSGDELFPPFVVQAVYEGEGEFDLDSWQGAAIRASAANPGSRLVLKGHLGWSRWVDSGVPVKVHLLDGENWNGTSPEGATFLKRPLPARSGPTCEVLLLTGIPKRVIIRVHHAVMDGGGAALFSEDLFRELRGEPSHGNTGFKTDLDMARKIGTGKFEMPHENCLPSSPPVLTNVYMPGNTWQRITIPGHCSKPLARIILTVAQHAFETRHYTQATNIKGSSKSISQPVVKFYLPVNMRQHCTESSRSTANLTGVIKVEVSETDTIADILNVIQVKRDSKGETVSIGKLAPLVWVPIKLIMYFWHRYTRRIHKNGCYLSSGVISNVGQWPIKRRHGAGFRATTGFAIPPFGGGRMPMNILFNSCGNKLEITVSVPNDVANGEQFPAFLEKLKAVLGGDSL